MCSGERFLSVADLRIDLRTALRAEIVYAHGAEIHAGTRADGHGLVLHVAVADDEHIRDLLHLGLADLVADLLAAVVRLGTDARVAQTVDDLVYDSCYYFPC